MKLKYFFDLYEQGRLKFVQKYVEKINTLYVYRGQCMSPKIYNLPVENELIERLMKDKEIRFELYSNKNFFDFIHNYILVTQSHILYSDWFVGTTSLYYPNSKSSIDLAKYFLCFECNYNFGHWNVHKTVRNINCYRNILNENCMMGGCTTHPTNQDIHILKLKFNVKRIYGIMITDVYAQNDSTIIDIVRHTEEISDKNNLGFKILEHHLTGTD